MSRHSCFILFTSHLPKNCGKNHWYTIWPFAILTGMRSGELHALIWEQINLEKNLILVDRY